MKILNLGSLNLDRTYRVEHFVQAGETIPAIGYGTSPGGKGLNQSVALARAGAEVCHLGAVGSDGGELLRILEEAGADTQFVQTLSGPSGHAIIQVTPEGDNCIIIFGGTNRQITQEMVDAALRSFGPGDLLLLQNETSQGEYAIREAKRRGLRIAFNPSPISQELFRYPFELVDYLLVNEIEGGALSDRPGGDPEEILRELCRRYPGTAIVLTIGADGVLCGTNGQLCRHGAYKVPVVDTTAAGDTFCGYFLSGLARGLSLEESLELASKASALAVSRAGAASSIPALSEVEASRL